MKFNEGTVDMPGEHDAIPWLPTGVGLLSHIFRHLSVGGGVGL